MLNLVAKTSNEKLILEYLSKNATESLVEKINSGKKTLAQCWSYIVSEARKLAQNNCACVEDATVFGWAMHFFEENSIKAETYSSATPSVVKTKTIAPKRAEKPKAKTEAKSQPKAKVKAEPEGQLSLFDF
jgi:cell division septation protein DedD